MAEPLRTISPRLNIFSPPMSLNPSAREWRVHGALFLLTLITTILAGVMLAAPEPDINYPPLTTPLDYLVYLPTVYLLSGFAIFRDVLLHPSLIAQGLAFSISLLAILFSHEMGHYLACRYYKVNATLPYFIPAPPFFIAGTLGAFIKIRSPIPSRRALFDIGLAGPLAGFVVALPLAVVGILNMQPAPAVSGSGIIFNDPLLFRLLARTMSLKLDPNSPPNPYYMAAWIGLLVTSLNLMPVGQLDGGHGVFAVFGQDVHRIIGRVAFVTMALLAVLGFWWHRSPSGFLYAVLLGVMLRLHHPQPRIMEPLGTKRILIAI